MNTVSAAGDARVEGAVSNSTFCGQQVDHFNAQRTDTFCQRYFVDATYWKNPDGPVIFNLCGEYTCEGVFPFRQWPMQLAQRTGALVVSLEHRYYGASQPFSDLATRNLAWLTVEQALADAAVFTKWFQQTQINAPAGKQTNNKWFIVGGSYPGALSAWYRLKYPHLSVGALASSAVVNSILDFTQFDMQIALSTSRSDKCVSALQQATAQVEAALPDIKAAFSAATLTNDADFLFLVADAAAEGVQYGHREELCGQMVDALVHNRSLAMQLANYTTHFFYPVMGGSASDYDSALLASPTYDPMKAGRQWWWQTCSALAWLQTAPQTNSIRSKRLTLSAFGDMCLRIFPELPSFPPDVSATNADFGGAGIAATNVIYTNGIEDPWRQASVAPPQNPSAVCQPLPASPSAFSCSIDCPQCAHCVDLYTPTAADAPQLVNAREFTSLVLKQWLVTEPAISF